MRTLHVHDRLIFGNFDFREMCVDYRGLAGVTVYVEKRSIKRR